MKKRLIMLIAALTVFSVVLSVVICGRKDTSTESVGAVDTVIMEAGASCGDEFNIQEGDAHITGAVLVENGTGRVLTEEEDRKLMDTDSTADQPTN